MKLNQLLTVSLLGFSQLTTSALACDYSSNQVAAQPAEVA
jgi:hypothetical protein